MLWTAIRGPLWEGNEMKLKSRATKTGGCLDVDIRRRKIVKLIAAGGASVIVSPWVFQAARSAGRTVKIGMISPQTGPIAEFAEADQFVLAGVRKALANGVAIGGETYPVETSIRIVSLTRTALQSWRRS